ncbi:MAG: hypothetical protein U0470_00165 [Anaerolineae bacterium]
MRRLWGGAGGDDPEPLRHQVVEILDPQVIDEYRLHALGCPRCAHVTRAGLPEGVSPSGFDHGSMRWRRRWSDGLNRASARRST